LNDKEENPRYKDPASPSFPGGQSAIRLLVTRAVSPWASNSEERWMTTTVEPLSAGLASDPFPADTDPVCEHRGCVQSSVEDVRTLANAVTLARTVGCLVAVTWSIASGQVWWLFVGLAVHWLGDIADGIVARRRHEETRAGAVLDIVSDRLCIALYYVSYGHLHHSMLVPIAVFLFQFMVLDAHLSLTFLNWPLTSLNYFGLVDRVVYAWNWSTLGKALNSGALVFLMLTTRSATLCTVFAIAAATVKVGSLVRVHPAGANAGSLFGSQQPVALLFDIELCCRPLDLQRLELLDEDVHDGPVSIPLVIGGNDVPRRELCVAALQRVGVGLVQRVPLGPAVDVAGVELPELVRLVEAPEQPVS
jgi:CDP-diacylglycerol--glycerol-3-phosphate 3-phosphatidyltransferase